MQVLGHVLHEKVGFTGLHLLPGVGSYEADGLASRGLAAEDSGRGVLENHACQCTKSTQIASPKWRTRTVFGFNPAVLSAEQVGVGAGGVSGQAQKGEGRE